MTTTRTHQAPLPVAFGRLDRDPLIEALTQRPSAVFGDRPQGGARHRAMTLRSRSSKRSSSSSVVT